MAAVTTARGNSTARQFLGQSPLSLQVAATENCSELYISVTSSADITLDMEETHRICLDVTQEQEETIQAMFGHWGWEYKPVGKH